jgi:PAS domain-containing protein
MHELLSVAYRIIATLTYVASYLSKSAISACASSPSAFFGLAAMTVSSTALAALCSAWFFSARALWSKRKNELVESLRRLKSELFFRDRLIAAYSESAVVFRADGSHSYRDGATLLKTCLAGPTGEDLANAIDALRKSGQHFECSAVTKRQVVIVRGQPVGRFAVVFLKILPSVSENNDRLVSRETPKQDCGTQFAQEEGISHTKAIAAVDAPAMKDRRQPALPEQPAEPIPAGLALFGRLATAIAIFGSDQKLILHNAAYEQMWGFGPSWLAGHPTVEEIFDQLHQARRLPEQRDYVAWKRDFLRLFEEMDVDREELWHLHGDKSVRVTIQTDPSGGLIFLFDDVSDRLGWERANRTLSSVQQATLDCLSDAVMIIGPDGRLKQRNVAFEQLWGIDREYLSTHPHFSQIATHCQVSSGLEYAWEIVASGVMSDEPERLNPWSEMTRSDGRIFSVAMTRLPDGAALVVFVDRSPAASRVHEDAPKLQVAA